MSFTKVCTVDDVWEGEMAPFTVNDHEIVLVCAEGGEIAAFQAARDALGISGGMLVANPVPEADEIPAVRMKGFIEASLASARDAGIAAKEVTPYLLADMFERTAGSSLKTNVALVMNNARLAADIAKAMKAG